MSKEDIAISIGVFVLVIASFFFVAGILTGFLIWG